MYLGIDLGTSEVKVLLLASDGSVDRHGGHAVHRFAAETALGGTESARLVGRHAHRALRVAREVSRTSSRRCAASASRDRCTAPCCSMRAIACCGRRSSGTTCAATRNARNSPSARRNCIASRAISRCPASPRRSCSGSRTTSRRSSAQTACVLLPKDYLRLHLTGTQGLRSVGRGRHALARRRAPRLVRRVARRLRHVARADARARRRQRAVGHAAAPNSRANSACATAWSSRRAAATTRPARSASARRNRATASSRSERRACCAWSATASGRIRRRRCMRSATRFPIAGIR